MKKKKNDEGTSQIEEWLDSNPNYVSVGGECDEIDSANDDRFEEDNDFGGSDNEDGDRGSQQRDGSELIRSDSFFRNEWKYSKNIVDGDKKGGIEYNWEKDGGVDTESDFGSVDENEDGPISKNGLIYNPELHGVDPPLACGLIFSSRMEFKDAVRAWNIKRGRHFKFKKNNKTRVMAKCSYENDEEYPCDWMISASRGGNDEAPFHIRAFREVHSCPYQYKNKSVKSGWLARKYSENFRINPKLRAFDFRKKMMQENKFFISSNQGYRTKTKALAIARGSDTSQYSQLHDYAHKIRKSNPGSTVAIKMTGQRFQRMYVCFYGVKQGFVRSCRPWFGIDGTFLKGPVGGVLLTAVGVDPNNGIYPIAYAVTEGENKDSWTWFLTHLKADLGIIDDKLWTIMSDKQKGLIQACDEILPGAEHRFCVKHLHSNWANAGFRGFALRKALWAAAKSTTPAQFSRRLGQIHEIDVDAGKWLEDKHPREWSRAFFSTQSKCDSLLNNVCETFNLSILDAREQPPLSMFEALKIVLMEMMQENRDMARNKWIDASICPRIFKKMEENCHKATMCVPHKANDELFEVWCAYGEQYAVNIKEKTCACRKWQLTGIPCSHGISALWAMNKDPMKYVDDCYSVAKYLECYDNYIVPFNGPHEQEQTGMVPPMPPIYAKSVGRPKKQRYVSKVEILEAKDKKKSVSKKGQLSRCSYCHEIRHNRRTCPSKKRDENEKTHGQDQENVVEDSEFHAVGPISGSQSEVTNLTFEKNKISDFSQKSFEEKYQFFGLEKPPYPVGEPSVLSNIRKCDPILLNQPSSIWSDISQSGLNLKGGKKIKKKEKAIKSATKQLEKNVARCSEPPISTFSQLSTSLYETFGLPVPNYLMDTNATKKDIL